MISTTHPAQSIIHSSVTVTWMNNRDCSRYITILLESKDMARICSPCPESRLQTNAVGDTKVVHVALMSLMTRQRGASITINYNRVA